MACHTEINNTNFSSNRVDDHPCYSKEAHHHYARIHLPVAPACNIQCNYCNRKFDCSNESRPGVTSRKLKPIAALKKTLFVGSKIDKLSVVGIAGPGDALANPKQTFETLKLINEYAPDLKLCISTNGLLLTEYIDELIEHKVDHITVTINTLEPEIGSKIYPWIYYNKKRYKGIEASTILIQKQLEGIEMAVKKGMLVKANSVLIPDINASSMAKLSKKLKEMGVFLHNIMPLLSEPEFGTFFGLNGVQSCTEELLNSVRAECGMDMTLMTHCQQCRSDAVGLITEDKKDDFEIDEIYEKEIDELVAIYDIDERVAKKERFKEVLEIVNRIKSNSKPKITVAVTKSEEDFVNQHFGSANDFWIYRSDGDSVEFVARKSVSMAYCQGSDVCGMFNPIDEIKNLLTSTDAKLVITAKIGDCPKSSLDEIGVSTTDSYSYMDTTTAIIMATRDYLKINTKMECSK
jgi:nitrogen fixation protein NifB